jgi:predicted outer membrane repeat protein
MTPGDGINDIQIWKDNSSYAVGANGTNEPANLNQGTNPGHVIYMRPIHTNITVDPTNINVSTAVDLHGALTYGNANVTMVDDITLSSIVRINFTDNLHDNVATLDLNGHTLDRGLINVDNVDQYGGVFHIWFGTMIVNDASGDNSGVIKGAYSTAGAIWNLSTFIFNGGTITENRSSYLGGGIYSYLDTEVIINGGVITNNYAADHGGAIYNEGSLTISNCTITNNSAEDHAGAIYNAGNLTISNCTINENTANDVGGIYNANIDNQYFGHATLTNCTLIANSSNISAGALANAIGATEMTLNNCTVQSNTAYTNGGGIWNGGTLTINGSDISYNTCYGTVGADGSEYDGKGGGIYHNGVALNMVGNPVVTRNTGGSNTTNNLYLDNSKVITVTGAFTEGASIGLSASNNDATLTSGYSTYNSNTAPDVVFFSDNRYGIVLVDNEVKFDTDANLIIFTTSGNWNDPNRWNTGTVPTDTDDVYVYANATIPANYIAQVNRITLGNGGSITIAEGGQLIHNNAGVVATVQKHINPYNKDKDGYYFLTNPVTTDQNPATLGMTANNYDLYWFDQSERLEWRNYKQVTFNLTNGIGYLYANNTSRELAFSGELNPANADVSVPLVYDANARFKGFNLVGNPFVCNAYLADGRDFYVLDSDGDEVVLCETNSIVPMQGVFVQAAANESSLSFTTTEPTQGRALNLCLTRNNGSCGVVTIDNARIRFGEGQGLEKYQLNPNHTKLYIQQNNRDYAVVNAEDQGEMPINFKASENGTYSLTVSETLSSQLSTFSYLHLIDNLTGADIDLLSSPTYTFEAKMTDYESRFKLVFERKEDNYNNNDNFAYFSNGELIVNGEGLLQVFDALGRQLFTKELSTLNSQLSTFTSPGVYVLRLINGNEVKTQKMVIQ